MNFFRTTLRYVTKDRTFSVINILGLSVGLAAVLCISIYIMRETNFDTFHKNAERIYRINISNSDDEEEGSYVFTPAIGPDLKANIPEIEEYARISTNRDFIATCNNNLFKLTDVCYADTSFFDIFTFPLLQGDWRTTLAAPFSIVLTEETATLLFGKSNPIGETIKMDMDNYTVTGIVKSLPVNSHIQFNALLSFSTRYRQPNVWMHWDGGWQYMTYLRLHKNADLKTVKTKMQDVIWENLGKDYATYGIKLNGGLHPLLKLHLHYDYEAESLRTGITVFSILALIILVIASINFVNLSTARSLRRVKEASVRKVLGAGRFGLVKQFFGESLLIAIVAFICALFLFQLFKPLYIQIAGGLPNANLIAVSVVVVFIFALITGFIGGSYPALRLSSLNLSMASKGGETPKNKRRLQSILIVVQFSCAIFLIVCTLVVFKQLSFVRNVNLGLNANGILVLPFNGETAAQRSTLLKQRLLTCPEISAVTNSSDVPCDGFTCNGYFPEGRENPLTINVVDVDEDFLEVYGIKLQEGRFFSGGEQDKTFYVVNDALVKRLEWTDGALGKYIDRGDRHEIIGTVDNFNYESLHSKIYPLIITNDPFADGSGFEYISMKYQTAEIPTLVSKVEKIWNEVNPDVPFEYQFFDEMFDSQYREDMNFRTLFTVFSVITILLAALGTFSLMAYTTHQRKKEIGIRKVLGGSVFNIIYILSKEFLLLVVIGFVIASPVAWWVMYQWLSNFAYKTNISGWVFVVVGFISLCVAFLSVGLQAFKAANANPVEAININ